jgi:nucleoside-diphosphate-sugar epimerase
MRILVTGGAGYIGSLLVPALLREGHDVSVIDSFMFRQASLAECCQFERFEIVRGDCRDEAVVGRAVRSSDVIIPLAALVGAPMCDRDTIAARTTNADAVRMLCRLVSPGQRILMPTTNSGYGIGDAGSYCTEESPLRPISLYGRTKVDAEQAVLDRDNGLSLRLATVFGMSPRMRLDLLVNDFVFRAVKDRALVVFEGHFKRNFIHIRDVVRAFLHALANFESMKGKPYNVGLDDANLSKLELCAAIKRHVPGFVWNEAQIGEDPDKRDYIVSNARIAATGYRTEWPLDRGIVELIKGFTMLNANGFSNV